MTADNSAYAARTRLVPISDSERQRSPTRQMTVIAQDPGVRVGGRIVMATIDVPAEDLDPGPVGYRVQVVDYDGSTQAYYDSHKLPASLAAEPAHWAAGDPRILDDFRFHAQNTYALIMKTLARFEFALGRRIPWSPRFFQSHQIKVAPHGMADANAFYSPEAEGLVFGYFQGATGRPVYTCLSHDIVVHETTHALLDALRERYLDPSNPDQAALHEGFSDVIALLSVFSQPEVVKHLLSGTGRQGAGERQIRRKDLLPKALRKSALFGLADEMGSELEGVRGKPLRHSATIDPKPGLKDLPAYLEAHNRGELFVAAVMQGFIDAWSERILLSGIRGQQAFPLSSVAEEGADIADTLATMWIRAVDYMPPVHVRFGDALSAALTADFEVRPDDRRFQLRKHMRASFARFGFRPASVRQDGMWSAPPPNLNYGRVRFDAMKTDEDEVFRFIWENRGALRIEPRAYTQVLNVRPSTRIGVDGFALRETVAQYYQVARLTEQELREARVHAPEGYLRALRAAEANAAAHDSDDEHDETPPSLAADTAGVETEAPTTALYGGAVLIFDEYGRLKYWIHNSVFGPDQDERLAYLWKEGLLEPERRRVQLRSGRFANLHRLRALGATGDSRAQRW